MIINFSIQNFYSVKSKVSLSFEANRDTDLENYYLIKTAESKLRLLKLGLIYGANASGKTTILRALDFFRHLVVAPLEKKSDVLNFNPFLFDSVTPTENSLFELDFLQNDVRYLYKLEFNKYAIIHEKLSYHHHKAEIYERTTDYKKQLTEIHFGKKFNASKDQRLILEANTLWNNTVLGGFIKTNLESEILRQVVDWFQSSLKPIIEPRTNLYPFISSQLEDNSIRKEFILEFLKKADFNITDIIVKHEENELDANAIELIEKASIISAEELRRLKDTRRFRSKKIFFQHSLDDSCNYTLNYQDESAGTQRYYQFSGLLEMLVNQKIIFPIDELESSLHPELLKHFLTSFLLNAKNAQLIASTHYRELLMEKDILRNDAIWFTEKKEDGSTDLFSLTEFNSSVVRNTSSVYNAYKIGKLGAVPELKDPFIDLSDDEK